MIKDTVLLHWQTVTNHVRLVSWLEGGANGKGGMAKAVEKIIFKN